MYPQHPEGNTLLTMPRGEGHSTRQLLTATRAQTMTYREEITQLDSLATPGPWANDGELYGVRDNGSLMPLGFAPHRPLDGCLVAVYRSAVINLIKAVDAIERLALRASANALVPASIGIRQVLTILDDAEGQRIPFRRSLMELDRMTTPPLWDPGHLVLGMELNADLRSLGIATPKPGDAPLIAVARIAVPRALELLAFAEATVVQHGLPNGCLRREGRRPSPGRWLPSTNTALRRAVGRAPCEGSEVPSSA